MSNLPSRPRSGEVLPPEARGPMQMPADTPLGLGFLGRARFDAIRRVLDARERAVRAFASNQDAEATLATAIVRKEQAFDQLRQIDDILDYDRKAMRRGWDIEEERAEIEKMKLMLEKLELQERLSAAQMKGAPAQRAEQGRNAPRREPSDYDKLVDLMHSVPALVAEAKKAKEEIIRSAGDDELSDTNRDVLDLLDTIVQGYVAKRGEDAQL